MKLDIYGVLLVCQKLALDFASLTYFILRKTIKQELILSSFYEWENQCSQEKIQIKWRCWRFPLIKRQRQKAMIQGFKGDFMVDSTGQVAAPNPKPERRYLCWKWWHKWARRSKLTQWRGTYRNWCLSSKRHRVRDSTKGWLKKCPRRT